MVGELGHRSDGRARGTDWIGLVDGNSGRNAFYRFRLWLVHPFEELARVSGERFDIAALALGIDRIEGKTRLS